MNTLSFTAAAAAILVLAGCQQKAETVTTTAPDPMAAEFENAAPVELQPLMKELVAFRCKVNSLAFVDFFSGDKLANMRTKKDGEIIRLPAENAGDPRTADDDRKSTRQNSGH